MNFDRENIADDERNDILSRLLQRRDELELKNFQLISDIEKIKEVWTQSKGAKTSTLIEVYLEFLCKEMFLLACETINKNKA